MRRTFIGLAAAVWLALVTAVGSLNPLPGDAHEGDENPTSHSQEGHPSKTPDGQASTGPGHEMMPGHMHVQTPPAYGGAHVPASAWTDPKMIQRGKAIYETRCAVCHGERGDGRGPAAAGLPVKPPDLGDAGMIAQMPGNYWFWRVTEGGTVEPFKSQGSAMPAWKDMLSIVDRWAVIAYQHTFSGHRGPHVTSEHPEMTAMGAGHGHGTAPPPPTGSGAAGHLH